MGLRLRMGELRSSGEVTSEGHFHLQGRGTNNLLFYFEFLNDDLPIVVGMYSHPCA